MNSMDKVWLSAVRNSIVKRYTGFTSAIEAAQCGFSFKWAKAFYIAQIALYRGEIDRQVHAIVQHRIANRPPVTPLPLP